jgi:hypothetical protein
LKCARASRSDSRDRRRRHATNLRCGACAQHHLRHRESRSDRPVRGLHLAATSSTTMIENVRKLAICGKANLASSDILRNRCRLHPTQAINLGDLPKTCHLLPFTAILSRQNRYAHFNRCICSGRRLAEKNIHDAGQEALRPTRERCHERRRNQAMRSTWQRRLLKRFDSRRFVDQCR